ncbi:uncharacterized protein LOC106671964 [Cimex lectularius]|uniref:Dephospho-CoA kinase domain-containing protein n=1 Tax=Cimex lectularius TaxID=79782 RepID=A0A8I6S4A2_CIMLE|nr:uncharacterized protein LOC106671964 [Cimex lectularius]
MYIVGLTGGIASGKSTVSKILKEAGIPVVDADFHARRVVEPGRKAWKKIKAEFGDKILKSNGQLDREQLGMLIFQDRAKRRRLNEITHPEIYKEMFWESIKCFYEGHAFIVLDLPLLFESGTMVDYCHKIIVVTCEPEQQLERLLLRDNLTERSARMRIESQMSLDEKARQASFVIDNSGTIEDTQTQVEQLIRLLKADKFHWKVRLICGIAVFFSVSLVCWLITTK